MADLINSWLPYQELSIEKDRDPVLAAVAYVGHRRGMRSP